MDVQAVAVSIIANSGDSKSYSLEAMKCIKKGDLSKAQELIKKADEALLLAHKTHTELLCSEANGESIPFSMFLMHSESHLTTAEVTREYVDALLSLCGKEEEK